MIQNYACDQKGRRLSRETGLEEVVFEVFPYKMESNEGLVIFNHFPYLSVSKLPL